MANQPTKYRKFVVGAASAALVASAVAPVAFAADFSDTKGNTHEKAIDALSDAGVIKGYEDGSFKPNKTLTRSDVVKMMGKWLVSEGYKVPTDYKTNLRFNDLKATTNDELLQMAALVKDNGLFVGTPDGKLDPAGDITRENMAIVIVRAFDRVHDINLASYVADQDFKKDVVDLKKAKAEAWPAIDVLDFFDITNPAAPNFRPKETTTRGQFASLLHKTLETDFSDVGSNVDANVASIKAINATTVEVAMKEKVDNINSLHFTIDGLTVSNAAVKQTDDKVVVLTTAVQKGGEKYTVTLNDKAIGSFTGVSAVVPSKISLNTQSVQGVVGQQVILSADAGVKEAGIPITFNVKADNNTLNKDQVFEVLTNADGIATFSYTQYNAGRDQVVAYPTGKAEAREVGYVYWANATQLNITDKTEGTTLANGSKKVYEISSAKNADKYVFVTFKENLYATPDKLVKTVNAEGVSTYELNASGNPSAAANYPYKASTSGEAVIAVKLDANGKANLVLTGSNAAVTPIVYEAEYTGGNTSADRNNLLNYKASYSKTALQANANTVTFTVQHALGLTVKAEGVQNAATYTDNGTGGRDYVVSYTDKDGKPAAKGTTVRVAIPKVGLANAANFKMLDVKGNVLGQVLPASAEYLYYDVQLEEAGKATFTTTSTGNNDYVAPVIFVENGTVPGLDKNDLQTVAEVTYFVNQVQYAAKLKAVNSNDKDITSLTAGETAIFKYQLVDQNGKKRLADKETKVTFGVTAGVGKINVNGTVYEAGKNDVATVTIPVGASEASLNVTGVEASSATVTATGSKAGIVIPTTVPSSQTVTFVSSTVVPSPYTGSASINTAKEWITFAGKEAVSYENATFKNINGNTISKQQFEALVLANSGSAVLTYTKTGDAVTFEVVSLTVSPEQTAASQVEVAINNLGPAKDLKLTDKAAVQKARADYDALSTAAKALVSDSAKAALKAAEDKIAELEAANPADVVFTSVKAESANILAQTFAGAVSYDIQGTVADAGVTEVTLTFTGKEDGPETVTATVTDGKFTFTKAEDDFFGDFNKVVVKYTVDGKEKTGETAIKVNLK